MKKTILLFLFATLFTTVVNANAKQGHFKWRNDDGSPAAATAIAAEDVNAVFTPNTNIRLRVEVYNDDIGGTEDYNNLGLFYSTDGTTWTRMTTSSSEFQLSLTDYYTEADATTNVLTETYGVHVDGFLIESTDAKALAFFDTRSYEFEYCFKATSSATLSTPYFFEIRDGEASTLTSYDRIPTLTIIATETVWTGANSTDYNDILNWTNGVPTAGHNVTIPVVATNYPTVIASTAGYCNNLEVAAGASLNNNNGGVLLASGDVIVQSDATNSGSLFGTVYNASYVAIAITYNRYVTGGQWHLMGAPFEGQDIGDLIDAAANGISFMKDYNTGTDTWNADFSGATVGAMTSGEGYAIKRATDGIISISGTVPSNPNVSLTTDGWNLLGNPYASAVYATDPGGLGTDYLLNASNVGSMATGFEALYVWEENIADPTNTNNYKTVNNAGSGDLNKVSPQVTHLQAGQGFFVKASATATTFDFTSGMQDHQSTLSLYKEEQALWPTVSLQAEIANAKASTTITYNSMMTKGMDKTYDAGLLNSYPEFALYSRLVEDYEGIDFMLQALPEDYDNLIVPIGLDAIAGEIITFSAQRLNIPEDYAVVLEDRAMNVFTDLSDGGEYAVQLDNASEGTGRFYVRTSFKSALGIDDIEQGAFQVFTRVNDYQLVIRGEFTANTVARIYSITGKQIANFNLDQATEQSVPFNEESGVYIVQISNEQGNYTQKFSWVK